MAPVLSKPWALVRYPGDVPAIFYQRLICCLTSVGHGIVTPDGDEHAENYSRDNADLQDVRFLSRQQEVPNDLNVLDLYLFRDQLSDEQVAERQRAVRNRLGQNGFQIVAAFPDLAVGEPVARIAPVAPAAGAQVYRVGDQFTGDVAALPGLAPGLYWAPQGNGHVVKSAEAAPEAAARQGGVSEGLQFLRDALGDGVPCRAVADAQASGSSSDA